LSYQEYLTAREYHQKITSSRFDSNTMMELFGDQPADAFGVVKQHLVLQLLAGLLSCEQRMVFLAVMAGGHVERKRKSIASVRRTTSILCVVAGCSVHHRNDDGYCQHHRADAPTALPDETVHGGDMLKINKILEPAGMGALAPYLEGNVRLRCLDLAGAKISNDGARLLANALKEAVSITSLDVSNNDLQAEGAQALEEVLVR
jgi:hypothetical protein